MSIKDPVGKLCYVKHDKPFIKDGLKWYSVFVPNYFTKTRRDIPDRIGTELIQEECRRNKGKGEFWVAGAHGTAVPQRYLRLAKASKETTEKIVEILWTQPHYCVLFSPETGRFLILQ